MNFFRIVRFFPIFLGLILWGARVRADTVDTKEGAHLVGKITKVEAGSVYLHTDYAGDIVIKQSNVTRFATDKFIAVRLDSGQRIDGQVTPAPQGGLQIAGTNKTVTTDIRHVAATWNAYGEDPLLIALRGQWTYEAFVDANGETGNHNQLGTSGGMRAERKATYNDLQLYAKYNRQVTDGQKSADQFATGVDYSTNYSGRDSLYVRDDAGFDRVMGISFSEVAAGGYGYDFIKQPSHTLTGRAGLSYR
ncbi:MAG: DUF481 domain-containing protein, partial [Opitutaceae bacterium]